MSASVAARKRACMAGDFTGADALTPGAARGRRGADRKSTRLNSSHVKISYAVFCLKAASHVAICTLSLHDALPIFEEVGFGGPAGAAGLAAVGGRDERDEGGDVRLGGGAETGLHGGGFYGGRRVDARGGKRAAGC